jgi:hypothetical protein
MDWRMFFSEGGKQISPWHDIPLSAGGNTYNFVCEIPKETDAKMECTLVRCHSQHTIAWNDRRDGICAQLPAPVLRSCLVRFWCSFQHACTRASACGQGGLHLLLRSLQLCMSPLILYGALYKARCSRPR